MMNFYETYECKIDEKGRLKLPSSLVKLLEATENKNFVVKRSVARTCLEIYPMAPWQKIMAKISKMNRFITENADFIRIFTSGVKNIELDASERILIPKDLNNFATLTKEVVIAGAGEIFEIWDKDAYEQITSISQEDFAKLSERVIGNISFDED